MRRVLLMILAGCAPFAIQAPAPAEATVVLLQDDRMLQNDYGGLGCGGPPQDILTPAIPFAPFDETLSSDTGDGLLVASQDSQASTSFLRGTGSVDNGAGSSHWCSISRYRIGFQADEATAYAFEGDATHLDGETFGEFVLSAGSDVFRFTFDGNASSSSSFQDAGVIPAGSYVLDVFVWSGATRGSFDFVLQLPEPGVATSLALALLALRLCMRAMAGRP